MLSGVAAVTGKHTWEGLDGNAGSRAPAMAVTNGQASQKLGTRGRGEAEDALPPVKLPKKLPVQSPAGSWVTWRCWAAFTQPDTSVQGCWGGLWVGGTPLTHGSHCTALPEWGRHRQNIVFSYETPKRIFYSWYLEFLLQITFHDPLTTLLVFSLPTQRSGR